ncbi:MAG: WD40 repeat domain-containing protein, partial [Planctomycetota bacterium]
LAAINLKPLSDDFGRPDPKMATGTIQIWDTNSGKLQVAYEQSGKVKSSWVGGGFELPISPGIAFDPTGEWLVSWPAPIEVRNLSTGEVEWTIENGGQAVFFDNGRKLAVLKVPGTFEVYEFPSGRRLETNELSETALRLSLAPETNSMVIASPNTIIRSTLPAFDTKTIPAPRLTCCTIARNGEHWAYGDRQGTLRIYASSSKSASVRMGHESVIVCASFSHSGSQIATASGDGTVRVWDVPGKMKTVVRTENKCLSESMFSADGESILYVGNSMGLHPSGRRYEPHAGRFEINGSAQIDAWDINTSYAHRVPRNDISFSHDKQFVVAPAREKSVDGIFMGFAKTDEVGIWSTQSRKQVAMISTGIGRILSSAWSRDGKTLAIGGDTDGRGEIRIYRINPSNEMVSADSIEPLTLPEDIVAKQAIHNIVVHPDGIRVALATEKQLVVYNLQKQQLISAQPWTSDDARVYLDYSPNGERLAAAVTHEQKIRVFDADALHQVYEVAAPDEVTCVRYSPDGQRLAAVGYASRVYLYHAATGHRLLILDGSNGSAATTARVIFSSDGRKIATHNWNGDFTVWEAELNRATPGGTVPE